MGVYAKALLVSAVVVAVTLTALVVRYGVSVMDAPWAGAWIAVAGLLVAGCVALTLYFLGKAGHSRLQPDVSLRPAADEPAPAAAADAAREDFFTDASFLAFVEQLMAATTREELLATVHAQLPPLIGGRHVWIGSELQKRTAEDEIVSATVSPGAQVTAEIQEWTTFRLRLNDASVKKSSLAASAAAAGAGSSAAGWRLTSDWRRDCAALPREYSASTTQPATSRPAAAIHGPAQGASGTDTPYLTTSAVRVRATTTALMSRALA